MKRLQSIGLAALMIAFTSTAYAEMDTAKGMTPAKRGDEQMQKGMSHEEMKNAPGAKATHKGFPTEDHKNAYKSLSGKNKAVYDTLSTSEQNKVVETHKKGGNHQKVMTRMLHEDQRQHNKSGGESEGHFWESKKHEGSPANKAMERKKSTSKKKDNIFD